MHHADPHRGKREEVKDVCARQQTRNRRYAPPDRGGRCGQDTWNVEDCRGEGKDEEEESVDAGGACVARGECGDQRLLIYFQSLVSVIGDERVQILKKKISSSC